MTDGRKVVLTVLNRYLRPIGYAMSKGEGDGFWVYIYQGQFVGYCPRVDQVVETVWEKTGENIRMLPGVKFDDLRVVTHEKVRLFGGWYQHREYFLGERSLGRIQYRRRNKRDDVLTLSANGGCVRGHHVDWLCIQNGHRLESE